MTSSPSSSPCSHDPLADLTLPWPLTVNTLWRRGPRNTYLSPRGRRWYAEAVALLKQQWGGHPALSCRLSVTILLYPPSRRKIDIDNRIKCVLDALVKASVIADDELIDKLVVERRQRTIDGGAAIILEEYHA